MPGFVGMVLPIKFISKLLEREGLFLFESFDDFESAVIFQKGSMDERIVILAQMAKNEVPFPELVHESPSDRQGFRDPEIAVQVLPQELLQVLPRHDVSRQSLGAG